MASLSLKRQGKMWALVQGTEILGSTAGGSGPKDPEATPPHDTPAEAPEYDNEQELDNLRTALHEAAQQGPLEQSQAQSEREKLQGHLQQGLAALERTRGQKGAWNDAAERELDELLKQANDLLKLTGLSVASYGHLG